jgi:hypothetical protein
MILRVAPGEHEFLWRRRGEAFPAAAARKDVHMRIHKVLQRRIRAAIDGVDLRGDVNAAVAANVGERSQTTHVSSRSTSTADTSTAERGGDARNEPERDSNAKGGGK